MVGAAAPLSRAFHAHVGVLDQPSGARWFAELTRKKLRRGVHTPTAQIEADIRGFIDRHNENPRPYKWTKSANEILDSVKRFCQKAEQILCHEL